MTEGPPPHFFARASDESELPADGTLGGYMSHHQRPPAFEASDGNPYTVSVEVEKTPDLRAPYGGYLVFPRWAQTGVGIMGHLETPLLLHGKGREEVMESLGALSLARVRELLEEAIARRRQETE